MIELTRKDGSRYVEEIKIDKDGYFILFLRGDIVEIKLLWTWEN